MRPNPFPEKPADRRRSPRLPAPSDVKGGVILIEHLDILDLSLSGVRFNCTRRLNPGQSLNLVLRKDDVRVDLRGRVLRSRFLGTARIKGENHNTYEVALAFEHAPEEKRQLQAFLPLVEEKTS